MVVTRVSTCVRGLLLCVLTITRWPLVCVMFLDSRRVLPEYMWHVDGKRVAADWAGGRDGMKLHFVLSRRMESITCQKRSVETFGLKTGIQGWKPARVPQPLAQTTLENGVWGSAYRLLVLCTRGKSSRPKLSSLHVASMDGYRL